jgi:type VI protein secretion system component VasA
MSQMNFTPVPSTHKTKALTAAAVGLAGLTITLAPTTRYLAIQAEAGDVRYTLDGTAPSASVGYLLRQTDQPVFLSRAEADNVQFYAIAGAATLQLCEYKE